jgi:hypothetical protein
MVVVVILMIMVGCEWKEREETSGAVIFCDLRRRGNG